MEPVRSLLEFAVEATIQAGKITLEYFQTDIQIETKPDLSPVTVADRRSEERIREMIGRYYPQHVIIGEEFGGPEGSAEYKWFVDPIDGTKAFVQGVPIYGVMLGLEARGEYVIGVVNFPALDEIVFAGLGEGCFWNHRRAAVSHTDEMQKALFCHSGAEYFRDAGRQEAYKLLVDQSRWERTWGDCYGHILVATGRADLCVDPVLHPWDAAPLIPIVVEAGGEFSDWKGTRTAYSPEGISTNGLLHQNVIDITRRF